MDWAPIHGNGWAPQAWAVLAILAIWVAWEAWETYWESTSVTA